MMLTATTSSTSEKRVDGFGRVVSALSNTLASCFSSFGFNNSYGSIASKKIHIPHHSVAPKTPIVMPSVTTPTNTVAKVKSPTLYKLCQRVRKAMVKGIMPKLCPECRLKMDRALSTGTGDVLCPSCRRILTSPNPGTNADRKALTFYESLTRPWCRYCGTTESRTWRNGPWGARTLCEEHASAHMAGLLDLSSFQNTNTLQPVVRSFCGACWIGENSKKTSLLGCFGCPLAYHRACVSRESAFMEHGRWYCSQGCRENCRLGRVGRVRLPEGKLPYEHIIDITSHTTDDERSEGDKENSPQPKAKRTRLSQTISVPSYRIKLLIANNENTESDLEHDNVSATVMQVRHAKYEAAEKKSRLLRPSVLSALTATSTGKKRPRAKSC